MIDNLTEAISHAREIAQELRAEAEQYVLKQEGETVYVKASNIEKYTGCFECAEDHEQLAAWLTELQERREIDRWIPVTERLPVRSDYYVGNSQELSLGDHYRNLMKARISKCSYLVCVAVLASFARLL